MLTGMHKYLSTSVSDLFFTLFSALFFRAQAPFSLQTLSRYLLAIALLNSPLAHSAPESVLRMINSDTRNQINLKKIDDANLKVDGILDEAVWATLPYVDDFVRVEPDTLDPGQHTTKARFFYDKTGLYISIEMHQPTDSLIQRLSGRDLRSINRDSVDITLDTSGTGLYGYWFGINLGDSLMDGTVLPERRFSSEWDGAWHGASQKNSNGWAAEFYIPWGTMSMPKTIEQRQLGIYISRKVAYIDERWGWPALPRTVPKFMSALQGLQLKDVNPGRQYSIYPFISATDDRLEENNNFRAGMDIFWRPSTNFQLTATVNPDFGAVESDDVVINLTATETFFAEKRLFFLEGQEIFIATPRASLGRPGVGGRGVPTTLINTRRIGGKANAPILGAGISVSERELIQPVELRGAIKATGQIGQLRYGFLSAFEEDIKFDATIESEDGTNTDINLHANGSNYGVARLIYEDSTNGAYRAIGLLSTAVLNPDRDAKTNGLDLHYLSSAGKIKLDAQILTSDIEGEQSGFGAFLFFKYNFRKGVFQRGGIEYFDRHLNIDDLGFLQRNDRIRFLTAHIRNSSNLGWARDNELDIRGFVEKNTDHLFTGGSLRVSNKTTFNNLKKLTLKAAFIPAVYDDLNSFGNGIFRIEKQHTLSADIDSDPSRKIGYSAGLGFRNENLGGNTYTAKTNLTWRPSGNFSLQLKLSYQDRHGWLLHQEDRNFTTFNAEQWVTTFSTDFFFNAKQQLRLSLQWVGIKAEEKQFYLIPTEPKKLIRTIKPEGRDDSFGLSQISFQVRYRWELAPLSDLFVVYTRVSDRGFALGKNSFSDIFENAYRDPIANLFVVKLRYRIGS
ncbi:MAG: hypothetical protein KUG79_12470 [Pseudomonadales bacterium]|nr:hypothetical protein [Pseudomonadales bacterium]